MDIQTIYQKTIIFATLKHLQKGQTIPGTEIPYVVHLSNVAMEILIASQNTKNFNIEFAIQVALLHDTLEDTNTTFEELESEFGSEIAKGVLALTKNDLLPKSEKMLDSLNRTKELRKEVWAVKLADRITNLQKPPQHWDISKKTEYKKEAKIILELLKGGNEFLENRLLKKINEYDKYIN
ncbi:MAG TPA: HD domain-containing protein [Saprospiraceae bacterium]|nr:HD domain-containing protein [Saprospiraceae bacterium]HMP22838.1 HD domain-containing protein [Saprospiraceae bacterium]